VDIVFPNEMDIRLASNTGGRWTHKYHTSEKPDTKGSANLVRVFFFGHVSIPEKMFHWKTKEQEERKICIYIYIQRCIYIHIKIYI
jgi:hypothetical protein